MKIQMSKNRQVILKKKNKIEGHTQQERKAYYKAIIIKTLWSWSNDRQIDQWNRLESRNSLLHTQSPDL